MFGRVTRSSRQFASPWNSLADKGSRFLLAGCRLGIGLATCTQSRAQVGRPGNDGPFNLAKRVHRVRKRRVLGLGSPSPSWCRENASAASSSSVVESMCTPTGAGIGQYRPDLKGLIEPEQADLGRTLSINLGYREILRLLTENMLAKRLPVECSSSTVSQSRALVIDDLARTQVYLVHPIIIGLDEQRPRVAVSCAPIITALIICA